MEYEFYRDFIDGSPKARFSFGHEPVGLWLEQEMGGNVSKLSALREQLQQIINDRHGQLHIHGKEFSLEADIQDATIMANDQGMPVMAIGELNHPFSLNENHQDNELNQDQSFSFAQCGTEDFVVMLDSWLEFLN